MADQSVTGFPSGTMIEKAGMQKPLTSPQLQIALSRWDTDGGAGPGGSPGICQTASPEPGNPPITDGDIAQLHMRVIALENLVIALLAGGTDLQLSLARAMAALITPREGATPHPLTIRAAAHIVDHVERSLHFRGEVST